ncbi:MAG: neutral zinc metallopeptidase [Neomegalonema sp.]|nr:neutral zinc metallopeptidase [Neomegalonema sp.]
MQVEKPDRRPLLGLAAAALALLAVPALKLSEPAPVRVIERGKGPYLAAAREIDAFWRAQFEVQFPETGRRYRTPKVTFKTGEKLPGAASEHYAGFYIERSESMTVLLDGPRFFVFLVTAHEFGHHVQHLAGLSRRRARLMARTFTKEGRRQIGMRYELQAECFAGVWAHHAVKTGKVLTRSEVYKWRLAATFSGDSKTHGSARQRLRWFDAGFEKGRASACDTFAPQWIVL